MMAALRFKSVVVVLAMTIDVNETSSRKESRGGKDRDRMIDMDIYREGDR